MIVLLRWLLNGNGNPMNGMNKMDLEMNENWHVVHKNIIEKIIAMLEIYWIS